MESIWIEKLAIQELCSRYCQTIDAQDSAGWAQCFLPDGAFEFDGHVIRGYEGLREYAEVHTRVMRGRHMTLNHLYEVEGDRATGHATTVVSIATPRATRSWAGRLSRRSRQGRRRVEKSPSPCRQRSSGVGPGKAGRSCRLRRCCAGPAVDRYGQCARLTEFRQGEILTVNLESARAERQYR